MEYQTIIQAKNLAKIVPIELGPCHTKVDRHPLFVRMATKTFKHLSRTQDNLLLQAQL